MSQIILETDTRKGITQFLTNAAINKMMTELYGAGVANGKARSTRVALIGDSLFARGFGVLTVLSTAGSFVVSGGIVTATCNATTNLKPGNYIQPFNPGDTVPWANVLNGANVPVLTCPSTTSFTCSATVPGIGTLADGDYTTIGGQNWQVTHLGITANGSWFRVLNAYLGNPFSVVANYAIGGSQSNIAIGLLAKMLAGPKFDYLFIQTGTNDVNTATTAALANAGAITALTNIDTLVQAALSYGALVYIGVPPPVGAAATNPTFKNIALAQLRYELVKLAKSDDRIRLIDLYKHFMLGTSATGDYLSGYTNTVADSIHPTVTASIALTKAEILAAQRFPPATDIQPVTILDDNYDNVANHSGAPYPNLCINGLFNGTGGTVGSPATGTVASSWSLNSITAGITVAAVGGAARTAGPTGGDPNTVNWGFAQTLSASGSAANQRWILTSSTTTEAALVAGNWYKAGLTIKALADFSHIQLLELQFAFAGGGNWLAWATTDTADVAAINMLSGDVIQLQTEGFFCAANINAFLQLTLTSSAASWSANIEITSAFIRQIDNPYA